MKTKIKAISKYIFISNPVTFFCSFTAVILSVVNGATGGFLGSSLLWFTNNELVVNLVFYLVVGLLGFFGAAKAGLETNHVADCRKHEKKCRKAEIALEAQIKEKACEIMEREQQVRMEMYMRRARQEIQAQRNSTKGENNE